MRLVIIGGSDAGISAGLAARQQDPTTDVTLLVADAYPNFGICGQETGRRLRHPVTTPNTSTRQESPPPSLDRVPVSAAANRESFPHGHGARHAVDPGRIADVRYQRNRITRSKVPPLLRQHAEARPLPTSGQRGAGSQVCR